MGAYNLLQIIVKCSNCHRDFPGKLQFKAGDTWQYAYHVGDKIKIEKEDKEIVGKEIVAYGILENEVCPFCAHANKEEYNIYINNGRILGVDDVPDLALFLDANEGRYYFLDKP